MNDSGAEIGFEEFALLVGGHTAFQLLRAGAQLGLYQHLARHPDQTRAEIADALALQPQPARMLLMGLTCLRVIRKDGDRYRNSAIASKLLVPGQDGSWLDFLEWQHHIVYRGQVDLVESFREGTNVGLRQFPGTGDTIYERLTHSPELETIFQRAMSGLSRSANRVLAEQLDLSDVKHLVDAGGGDATNGLTLAGRNPSLRVTIFDQPSICARANENIAAAGLGDRVRTHAGDLFDSPFPEGIDAVLLAHMMTIWSPQNDVKLLRRVYQALPSGGRVIIFNMMGSDQEDGPHAAALGSPYFLAIATGEGMLYSWRDYESFLAEAGFRQTIRRELPANHGLLVGIK